MIDQDIQSKIDTSKEVLKEAKSFYESSDYNESERCTREVLALLEPHAERVDLGEERDKNSQKYALIYLIAHAYNRQNLISISRDEYALALSQAETALLFTERIGFLPRKADLLNNIGLIFQKLTYYTKALEYYQLALGINEELGSKEGIAKNIGNIGLFYTKQLDYDNALKYLLKALAMAEELGNKIGIAINLLNIGVVYEKLPDNAKALEYYKKSLATYEELGNKNGIATILGNFGEIYAKPDYEGYDPAKAEEFLLKGIAILEEIGVKTNLSLFHKIVANLYKAEKRWEECQIHFEKFYEIEKEVQSDEAKKQAGLIEQRKQAADREKTLAIERERSDATTKILHQVLPASIADRLIKGEKVADYFSQVSILFADIVGFTPIASKMPARKVLAFLNYVFGEFDRIIETHGCEKIKTIGDGYMAVAGAPIECPDHAERIARAAIEMMGDIQLPEDIRSSLPKGAIFNIRIGIHIGPAFGGIVGEKRFVYDVYSDAVNTAARMESHGEPGRIHVSEEFAFHLQNRMDMTGDDLGGIVFVEREQIEIKGKGMMKTYFLENRSKL